MTLRFVPMRPEDVERIVLQPDQANSYGLYSIELSAVYGQSLVASGPAWTGFDPDGRIVGMAGFHVAFPTQAAAWALLGESWPRHRIAVSRFVRGRIATAPWRRIEAMTRAAVPRQSAWARTLGFRKVAELANCGPACETMILHEVLK